VILYPSEFNAGRANQSWRQRVAELVGRYPSVSDDERREILDFMRHGRHLDIGLLTSSDTLRPQLDAFMADHKRQLQISLLDVVAALVVLAAAFMVCALVWSAIAPTSA
jgi:hypothetical protein